MPALELLELAVRKCRLLKCLCAQTRHFRLRIQSWVVWPPPSCSLRRQGAGSWWPILCHSPRPPSARNQNTRSKRRWPGSSAPEFMLAIPQHSISAPKEEHVIPRRKGPTCTPAHITRCRGACNPATLSAPSQILHRNRPHSCRHRCRAKCRSEAIFLLFRE